MDIQPPYNQSLKFLHIKISQRNLKRETAKFKKNPCKLAAQTTFFTKTAKIKLYKQVDIWWYFPTNNFELQRFEEFSCNVSSFSKNKYLLLKRQLSKTATAILTSLI